MILWLQVMVTDRDDMDMDEEIIDDQVIENENGFNDSEGLRITILVAISKPSQKQARQVAFLVPTAKISVGMFAFSPDLATASN
jgi:hypothetical protein